MALEGPAKERDEGRTANFDGGTWTYQRQWEVRTTDKNDRENIVSTAPGLPAYGELHPAPIAVDAWAKTIAYAPVTGSAIAWIVTVTYTSERELNENPTTDEVLISWSSEIYPELVNIDRNGAAIVNSAGDYFIDPVPTRDGIHLIAKIRANVGAVPSWLINYQNAVNNDEITIGGLLIGVGLARVQRIEVGERQKRGNVTFYPLSFEVHIHKDGWRLRPLDAGFRKLDGTKRVQIGDKLGSEPTTPVPLNGGGQPLEDPGPTTAVFGNFKIYDELDLTALPGIV